MTTTQAFQIEKLVAELRLTDEEILRAAGRIRPGFKFLSDLTVTESDALIQDLEAGFHLVRASFEATTASC